MIINEQWLKNQYFDSDTKESLDEKNPEHGYILGILRVGRKVLDLMEEIPVEERIEAQELVFEANRIMDEGITGNMAAYVALIATKCHSRGQEFRKSWNASNGSPESSGVVNPAILHLKD